MNILILGSGGREHALAWKIRQSNKCDELYIAPGNAGTLNCGMNVAISPEDFEAVKKFVVENNIQMLVVGPEAPLVKGIHDYFLADAELKHIAVIGPQKAAAALEGSKDFAKSFMARHNIPTAQYQTFDQNNMEDGIAFIEKSNIPIVLKADGLAAGKGVLICQSKEEAKNTLHKMIKEAAFGAASKKVVIEEFLDGIEFSVFVLTDGKSYKVLPIAKDYKRIGEGDTGLNTGGMGAVSPVPFVNDALMKKVEERIIQPTVKGLQEDNLPYKGIIFIGLIKVNDNPFVIEYNVRFGDPETEVVLPRLKSDLVDLFEGVANSNLSEKDIEIDKQTATTVMLVSAGYPGNYNKGEEMNELEEIEHTLFFHAGTQIEDNVIKTNGGRVLAVTGLANNMTSALALSNKGAEQIQFEGKNYRKDIGFDLV